MKKIMLAGFSIMMGLQLFAYPATTVYPTSSIDRTPSVNLFPSVNEKVLKTFKESFPNAEKVTWDETKEFYTVNFLEQGILTRITYEKSGNFAGSIRYYTERYLPYYLINVLKDKFPGRKIYGVTEVTGPSGILYYVKLESTKFWLTVLLNSEGVVTIQEKFRKAQ
jgi:hypothetical protein